MPIAVVLILAVKNSHKMTKNYSGFTLIEMIVVVGIIITLGSIGVASYNNFNEGRQRLAAAEELISNLRQAQNNSQTGKKITCTSTLEGWYINFSENKIQERCSGVNNEYKTLVNLPGGITISGGQNFLFLPLSGKTDLPADLNVLLTGADDDDQIWVQITPSGQINLLNSPTP